MSRKNISEQTEKQGRKIKVVYAKEQIISENSDYARELCNSGSYGVLLEDGRVQFSAFETLYLMEKGKVELIDFRGRTLSKEELIKKASRSDKEFLARYAIFKDLRTRGYVVKTALKFGADFRVYDRGVKPGEDHAKWIVYAVHESGGLTWHDFAAKNRVAHSTKKKLLIGILDDEGDITYYEIRWIRP